MKERVKYKFSLYSKAFVSIILAVLIFSASTEAAWAVNIGAELLDNDKFGMAVSQCIKEDKKSSCFDSQRVIGQTEGTVNFKRYKPDEVITAEDGRFMLKFDSVADAEKCINSLSRNSNVLYVEADNTVEICAESKSKDSKSLSWGSTALQNDKLIDCLKDVNFNRSVTVAIVDSGAAEINYLKGHLVEGYDYVDNDSDPSNDTSTCSHGTFLSSIVVDNTRELPINIMPIRIISRETSTISNVANGIYYAADHGADVINLSLGGEYYSCEVIDNAVEYAVSKNIAVVVSAGNESENTKYCCPAHNVSAITVSAVESDMKFADSYSNFGSAVDFAAPGTGIIGYDASGKKITLDGTSMSAAFISSCMAILKLLYPSASLEQLQSVLADSSVNPGSINKNSYYGFGIPQMMFFSGYTNGGIYTVPDKKILVTGETYNFRTYYLSNLSTVKKTEWTSSDESVAKVDSNGNIKALKAGKTEVVCVSKQNNKTSKCIVNVKKIDSISVSETPSKTIYAYKLEEFDPTGIEITVNYTDGTKDVVGDCSVLSFDGFNQYEPGSQKIKVSYFNAETDFNIDIGFTWWQMLIRIFLFGWIWY